MSQHHYTIGTSDEVNLITNIQIYDLRISFIWVESSLALLRDPVPSDALFAFLGSRLDYAKKFEQVKKDGNKPGEVGLPWPKPFGQRFWTFYLEGKNPGDISGNKAWSALLPFRRKEVSVSIKAPWLRGNFILESYFYPHAIGLVITARCQSQLTLDEAIEIAFKIRESERVDVEWDEGTVESLPLEVLADKCLNNLRYKAFGQKTLPEWRSLEPFTVLTVVRGEGIDPNVPLLENGEVHRGLEAMTTWHSTWQYDVLPTLAEASVRIRRSPPSHILYGRTRGRLVWFPGLFTPQKAGKRRSLTCYHRNLVFNTLQVESLGGLISLSAKNLREGILPSGTYRECAQKGAGIMGRLYGGVNDTYRSWSARVHIEQNNMIEDLNEVRSFFNMPALHKKS